MTTTGVPGALPPAPRPAPDHTRTIAVVALVLAVLALAVPVLTTVVPLVAFGVLTLGTTTEVTSEMAPLAEGTGIASYDGSASGLRVPAPSGSVEGAALAAALDREGFFLGEPVSCPDVAEVAEGATALCEVGEGRTTYVVLRFAGTDGAFDADWFTPDAGSDPFD